MEAFGFCQRVMKSSLGNHYKRDPKGRKWNGHIFRRDFFWEDSFKLILLEDTEASLRELLLIESFPKNFFKESLFRGTAEGKFCFVYCSIPCS